jgi:hypothetical protein
MSDSTERLGEMLHRLGALSLEEIDDILRYQKDNPDILFGQIAVMKGYITKEVLDKYLN